MFQRYSTLNAISGGRAEVILGRGSSIESFPLFGYDLADYDELFEEKATLFAELLKGGPVTWEGKTRAALLNQDGPAVEAQAAHLIQTDVGRRGEGAALSFAHWADAVLCNSLGRYEQALAAAQRAREFSRGVWFADWALAELIEAAVRSAVPERPAGALRRLSGIARACGTDWVLGVEARSRALVSDGEDAENLYREATHRLGRIPLRMDLGRAHLVYGEWLRRQRRRRDAHDQLASAYEIFHSIGAAAFAERARIELRASGGQARERIVETRDPLTAQEALIARLAGEGASNPDIAAQLFISSATVSYHLRKVFTKLDISSRSQLARALPARQGTAPPVTSQR